MFSTKIRITITTLVASAGFGLAALLPAASQAQWHTLCDSSGHCTEHKNFTIGGKDPCEEIQGNYNNAREGLLNALDTKPLYIGGASAAQAEAERAKEIAEEEGRVAEAEREAFVWGCPLARKAPPTQPTSTTQGATAISALPRAL